MVIGITALSLMLRKTALVVALAMIPVLAIYIYAEPSVTLWLSLKPLLVGILMFGYVYTYNMSKVTKGLRQPREINQERRRHWKCLPIFAIWIMIKQKVCWKDSLLKCVSVLWGLPLSG